MMVRSLKQSMNPSDPASTWSDRSAFEDQLKKLAGMFAEAFVQHENEVKPEVLKAGPHK